MGIVVMLDKIFVLGRPGSGKTTAVNHILEYANSERCAAQRFKDYEILYQMFQDDIHEQRFRRAEHGGFDVLDNSMFDKALEQLEENVTAALSSGLGGIVTIEFARDDYQRALHKFSPNFLKDAHVLFVNCDLEECMRRIYGRMSNPPRPDFHFVSEYIMQTYYNKENMNYMLEHCKEDFPLLKKITVIENTSSTLEEFKKQVRSLAKDIIVEELLVTS